MHTTNVCIFGVHACQINVHYISDNNEECMSSDWILYMHMYIV